MQEEGGGGEGAGGRGSFASATIGGSGTGRMERGPRMRHRRRWTSCAVVGALSVTLVLSAGWGAVAQGAEPIKIGFGMALTGGLAPNRQAALSWMQPSAADLNQNRWAPVPPARHLSLHSPQLTPHPARR